MVAHEIGVLGEVDGLERQAAEALAPVDGLILGGGGAAAAGLGAPLPIHGVQLCLARRRLSPPLFDFYLVRLRSVTTLSAKSNRAQLRGRGPLTASPF